MDIVYKIQHKETKLFKRAGYHGGWNKVGKSWASRQALSGHIALYKETWRGKPPSMDLWEIVEYRPVENRRLSIDQYISERKKK